MKKFRAAFLVFCLAVFLAGIFWPAAKEAQGDSNDVIQYMRDKASYAFAHEILKEVWGETVLPVNYDNFLEIQQVFLNAGQPLPEVQDFEFLGQTVKATGNDPLTFYIETSPVAELIESLKGTTAEAFPLNYPVDITTGGGVPTPPSFGPVPSMTGGVMLDIPPFLQTDPLWAKELIDQCSGSSACWNPIVAGNSLWCSGCGPTSLAMVLKYFGKEVTPLTIAQLLQGGNDFICGIGSRFPRMANLAYITFGLNYSAVSSLEEIKSHLEQGHPVVGGFNCFQFSSGKCSGHISVIKGMGQCTIGGKTDTCVYFQDTFGGEMAFFATTVSAVFKPIYFYAFYK